MSEPRVAAVVLNWKRAPDTIACVHSLQTSQWPVTPIVVDNDSQDDSVAAIRAALPSVTLIESSANLGFAGGNNLGIRAAMQQGFDFVLLINNDATVAPDTVGVMMYGVLADEKRGAVGATIYEMTDPDLVQSSGGGWYNLWLGIGWTPRSGGRLDYITGTCLLLRCAALSEVGLLDEKFFFYFEDTDLCWRLRRGGWTLAIASGAKVLHAGSATVGSGSPTQGRYMGRSYVRFLRKHAPVPIVAAIIGGMGKVAIELYRRRWPVARGFIAGWCAAWREGRP